MCDLHLSDPEHRGPTDFDRAVLLMADAVMAGRAAALAGHGAEVASCAVIVRRASWFAAHALHDVPVCSGAHLP